MRHRWLHLRRAERRARPVEPPGEREPEGRRPVRRRDVHDALGVHRLDRLERPGGHAPLQLGGRDPRRRSSSRRRDYGQPCGEPATDQRLAHDRRFGERPGRGTGLRRPARRRPPVRSVPASCAEPYTAPTPCPPSLVASFDVDSTSLAPGAHTAELYATDAAGNVSTGPAVSFTVASRRPGRSPSRSRPDRRSRGADRGPARRLPRAGRGRGQVTRQRDRQAHRRRARRRREGDRAQPAVRRRRSSARRERTLTTDAQGRFSMSAEAPPGSSSSTSTTRRIARRRRSRFSSCSGCASRHAERARASQRLGHDPARRRGRRRSRRARQGRARPGDRRRPLDDGRGADAQRLGRRDWRYRFKGTTRSAIYRFRVRVPTAGDVWPWPTTDSPTLKVRVAAMTPHVLDRHRERAERILEREYTKLRKTTISGVRSRLAVRYVAPAGSSTTSTSTRSTTRHGTGSTCGSRRARRSRTTPASSSTPPTAARSRRSGALGRARSTTARTSRSSSVEPDVDAHARRPRAAHALHGGHARAPDRP